MGKYNYYTFGLIIQSEFRLPELMLAPEKNAPDVEIMFGKVPLQIENIISRDIDFQLSKTEFLFSVDNIARFYIGNGRYIIIEPFEQGDMESIKAYLLGSAMGTLLLQRRMIPIHGSSIVINEKGVIFTGNCGAGKSTICAALRKEGYEFLSDDISVVDLNGDIPIVIPSFPQQKLSKDTILNVGYELNELPLVCNADNKYLFNNCPGFREKATELAAIIEIIPEENSEVEIIKLAGFQKAENFIKNIYCSLILNLTGMAPEYFKKCLKISNIISICNLKRPSNKFTVNKQIALVKKIV